MFRNTTATAVLLLAALCGPGVAQDRPRNQAPKGFTSLFNGKDLTGWNGRVDEYQVEDGAIMCQPGKGGTIYVNEEDGDFEAKLEFKLPPAGNNGLAIRYPGKGDTAYVGMCELQILDDSSPKYATPSTSGSARTRLLVADKIARALVAVA